MTINGDEISDNSISDAVNALHAKGFIYAEINDDCIIFWKDYTGYYGVLYSNDPEEAIERIKEESRPYLKSKKLADDWYEIGVLDSI